MNVISRSAITITYKKPFIDWNNTLFPNLLMHENMIGESKTYLIDELFNDAGAVIKKHYTQIFEIELEGICIDESEWPTKRTLKLFNEWFSLEVSDCVMDLSKKDIMNNE